MTGSVSSISSTPSSTTVLSKYTKHKTLEKKTSLAYIPWLPKRDAIDCRDVILEIVDVIKNQALRLTHRMVTVDPLICGPIFQVNVFHIVHHIGDITKMSGVMLIQVPFVTNTNYILGLLVNKGELYRRRVGISTWTFFLTGASPIR